MKGEIETLMGNLQKFSNPVQLGGFLSWPVASAHFVIL